jgi:hypothetical protein
MPGVRGDGMRGLAVFISDIRNCEYIRHSRLIFLLLLSFRLSWETRSHSRLEWFMRNEDSIGCCSVVIGTPAL